LSVFLQFFFPNGIAFLHLLVFLKWGFAIIGFAFIGVLVYYNALKLFKIIVPGASHKIHLAFLFKVMKFLWIL
jgi:hypothetical protein